ncbi:MAG: hypothetical protein J0H15_12695 [Xanthomonadales bacterium]|nr:hypothetical protein [Xanthomonadales bacterium]
MNRTTGTRLALGAALALTLSGYASAATVDAAAEAGGDTCGRISTFDVAPRQEKLHEATIISVDGQLPGPRDADAWRVSAGHHVLEVGERIDNRYLSFNDRQRNSGNRYKSLEIDVPADTTLLIAARLDSSRWNDGNYWQPVVWKEVSEPCR